MTPLIQRIDHIRGFGSFRDWEWDNEIPDLARYTLIYGWNGSGKTTLARLLRSIEIGVLHDIADAETLSYSVVLDGDRIIVPDSAQQLGQSLRVFDQDYVKDNLRFDDDQARANPLLVLGKENLQLSDNLAAARTQARELSTQIVETSSREGKAESALSDRLADIAREIKQGISRSPTDDYATYNQAKLKSALDALPEGDTGMLNSAATESAQLDVNATRLGAIKAPGLVDVAVIRREVLEALDQISKSIPVDESVNYGDDAVVLAWLSQGVVLHPIEFEACLFCTSTIPSGRLASLHERFSKQYRDSVVALELRHERLSGWSADVGALNNSIGDIDDSNIYANLRGEWSSTSERLEIAATSFRNDIRRIDGAVLDRLGSLNETLTPRFEVEAFMDRADCFGKAQQEIQDLLHVNNRHATKIDQNRHQAQEMLERGRCLSFREEYLRLVQSISDSCAEKEVLQDKVTAANLEVERLERQASSQTEAVKMLNGVLELYFGNGFLMVEPLLDEGRDVGLQLRRSGAAATYLSEGERGGIALAYFLVEVRDAVDRGERLIVVLDDPVSSLDDNGLFQAEALVRGIGTSVDQLIVLTHNFTFFRRVRRWMLDSRQRRKESQFLYLTTVDDDDHRVPVLRDLPDLLRKHESDYQYLFSVVAAASGRIDPSLPDSELAQVPNAARRVLETFLGFRCPNSTDFKGGLLELKQQQPGVFSEIDVNALAAFLDEGSHDRSLDTASSSLLASYLDRRRYVDVLQLIERADAHHYAAMINVCLKNGFSAAHQDHVGVSES